MMALRGLHSSKVPSVSEGLLCIAPQIYREYAAEFREMARTSESDQQRAFYLKGGTYPAHTISHSVDP